MKLPLELLFLIPPALSAALAPRSATVPHLNGLTSLSKDLSTSDTRFPDKYFHESIYHQHYDGRFAANILPRKTRLFHMRLLLRSYTQAMQRAGVRTWIMHGSLLGWWWNGSIFPWDSDLDVCVEEDGMRELGTWWNMTVHTFTALELGLEDASIPPPNPRYRRKNSVIHSSNAEDESETPELMQEPPDLKPGTWTQILDHGKKYLLEINPHYKDSSTQDKHNVIDARWIDTTTGLFIDITTIHPVPTSATAKSHTKHQIFLEQGDDSGDASGSGGGGGRAEEMYTKDTHLYTTASLFPLRESRLEGTRVFVPYAYERLLREEYGPRALVETGFSGWEFDKGRREWVVAPAENGR